MQLNIYVPKEKARLVEALDEATKRTGRQKNDLVLEALEAYLTRVRPVLDVFHLGPVEVTSRSDLYLEHQAP